MRQKYVVAFYDVDQAFGGPEEGGWWYTIGSLVRLHRVFANEDDAYRVCRRLNAHLDYMQRDLPSIYHSNSRGRIEAMVFENTAPEGFPAHRPHYE